MNGITKITLYADDKPYQVLDLKALDEMTDEEYNDKLRDAWFKETHYKTVEELTMAKYYNYEVKEQEEKPESSKLGFTGEILGVVCSILFCGGILGTLFWLLANLVGG